MDATFTNSSTTLESGVTIPEVGLSVNSPFKSLFDNFDPTVQVPWDGILRFIENLWLVYVILAYLFSILLLILYVYASVRFKQLSDLREESVATRERIYDERFRSGPKNNRLNDVMTHIASENPNDWKLAIIEADIILDQTLKTAGYAGNSLGERLKSINPSSLKSLDAAWQAHKVRNQIAHEGADFVLTKRLAEETIKQYKMVFSELGVG
jgi:hypothetical protein